MTQFYFKDTKWNHITLSWTVVSIETDHKTWTHRHHYCYISTQTLFLTLYCCCCDCGVCSLLSGLQCGMYQCVFVYQSCQPDTWTMHDPSSTLQLDFVASMYSYMTDERSALNKHGIILTCPVRKVFFILQLWQSCHHLHHSQQVVYYNLTL